MIGIIEKVRSLRHGAFVRIKYRTDVKPSAKFKDCKIEKIVEATVRVGVSYSNLSAVKERRTTMSQPMTSTHAQWWRWCDGYRNIMKEKISDSSQKVYYIRHYSKWRKCQGLLVYKWGSCV